MFSLVERNALFAILVLIGSSSGAQDGPKPPDDDYRVIYGGTDPLGCVAISSDGEKLAIGTRDWVGTSFTDRFVVKRSVRIIDAHSSQVLSEIKHVEGPRGFYQRILPDSLAFTVENKHLVSFSMARQSVDIWETATGKHLRAIKNIAACNVCDHESVILTANNDGLIQAYNSRSLEAMREMKARPGLVAIAYCAAKNRVITCSCDGVAMWDFVHGVRIHTLDAQVIAPGGVISASGGEYIVIGDYFNNEEIHRLRVWWPERNAVDVLFQSRAQDDGIRSISYSPKLGVALLGTKARILLWNPKLAAEARPAAAVDGLTCMTFGFGNDSVILGTRDGKVSLIRSQSLGIPRD